MFSAIKKMVGMRNTLIWFGKAFLITLVAMIINLFVHETVHFIQFIPKGDITQVCFWGYDKERSAMGWVAGYTKEEVNFAKMELVATMAGLTAGLCFMVIAVKKWT